MKQRKAAAVSRIESTQASLDELKPSMGKVPDMRGKAFSMTLNGKVFTECKKAGAVLLKLKALNEAMNRGSG